MSAYQIEKLSDQNYDVWSVQMRSVLVHQELWSIVSGKLRLTKESTSEEAVKWNLMDQKALACIILNVNVSQFSYVKNATSALAAWAKLREVYVSRGPLRKVLLFKKLLNSKYSAVQGMVQYLNNFVEIIDKLTEVNVDIPEELKVIILMSSLSAEYEHFVVAMETKDSLPVFESLKVKLLAEAERINEKNEKNSKQHAYYAG